MRASTTVYTHLRRWEGFKQYPYQDQGGVWTAGYGHTGPDVKPRHPVSRSQAEAWLAADIRKVEAFLDVELMRATQEQYDALLVLGFNIGLGSLKRSKLLRLHNEFDFKGAAAEFDRWNHVHGKTVEGLTRRRFEERRLYEAGCPRD